MHDYVMCGLADTYFFLSNCSQSSAPRTTFFLTDVRLMSLGVETTSLGYGRVEVRMNGEWATICDDGFDVNAAKALCTHLGFSQGEIRTDAFYGEGTGEIFVNDVECTGDETFLYECKLTRNFDDVCTHAEDVGVVCSIGKSSPKLCKLLEYIVERVDQCNATQRNVKSIS